MKIKFTIIFAISLILTNIAFGMDNASEMKAELAQLVERQETLNRTIVPMWGAKHRFNSPGAASSTIETSGLAGCIATVAAIKYENGSSCSILTHFPPIDDIDHGRALKKQIELCNETAQSPVVSSRVEILVPGEYPEYTDNKMYRLQAGKYTQGITQLLDFTHKAIQGDNAKSSVTPYNQNRLEKAYANGITTTHTPDLILHHRNNDFALYCNICDTYNIGFDKK